jgi:hypothetical protein
MIQANPLSLSHKNPENQLVFGARIQEPLLLEAVPLPARTSHSFSRTGQPSFIRTVPSAPEFHRIMHLETFVSKRSRALPPVGILADFWSAHHPAPKVIIQFFSTLIVNIITKRSAAADD